MHFKHCREVASAIRGLSLEEAKSYLGAVLEHKRAIPFRRFNSGCSQHAQGKPMKAPGNSVRWPEKATRHFIDLLENAEANAEVRTPSRVCVCIRLLPGGWIPAHVPFGVLS